MARTAMDRMLGRGRYEPTYRPTPDEPRNRSLSEFLRVIRDEHGRLITQGTRMLAETAGVSRATASRYLRAAVEGGHLDELRAPKSGRARAENTGVYVFPDRPLVALVRSPCGCGPDKPYVPADIAKYGTLHDSMAGLGVWSDVPDPTG